MPDVEPSGIDLRFEISDGVSKAIEAVARLVEQGLILGHDRYKEMDESHQKRLDEVLVRTSERGNEFLEAVHRLIFKEPKL